MLIALSPAERLGLEQTVSDVGHGVKEATRAQALLWLDQGEQVEVVMRRLGVSRQTVYNWANCFLERRAEPVAARLKDRAHLGRPPKKRRTVQALVQQVIEQDPRQSGYDSPKWTVSLLHRYVVEQGIEVSERTVRRVVER